MTWFLLTLQNSLAHEGHDHGSGDSGTRVWTLSDTGARVHASFVASQDGKVQVRRADGKVVALEIAKLTAADQKWIEQKVLQVRQLNENTRTLMSAKFVATKATSKPAIADSFEPYAKSFSIKVVVGNETRYVNYVLNDNGSVKFDFVDGNGKVKSETYSPRQRGPGGGGGPGAGRPGDRPPRNDPPPRRDPPPRNEPPRGKQPPETSAVSKPKTGFMQVDNEKDIAVARVAIREAVEAA